MTDQNPSDHATAGRFKWPLIGAAFLTYTALVGALGWAWQGQRAPSQNKAEIETVVRNYILTHPEVLPEAMERLRNKEQQQQVAAVGDDVDRPFPGAVLGNPAGTVTLVEFTDYACTYCRKSVADVEALVAANPDLRVVIRDLPILSPASADAARMALAAAAQGRYAQFHKAMFARGRLNAETIAAAATEAGMDLAAAQRVIADPKIEAEIARNQEFARKLGINGTPSWLAGDQLLNGAVGLEELSKAVAEARS